MLIMNAWYAAAWSNEVGRTLLARRLCDKPVLLYRREDGSPVAMADLCRHRLLPLSLGKLDGDAVVCGYHGFTYGSDGRCTRIPGREQVSRNFRVRTYPVVERHRFVWVWMGEPTLADPDAIPNLWWNDHREWAGAGGATLVDCDYRLILDNLLDLTHETFVHSSSIGDAAVAEAPFSVAHEGHCITVTRWMIDHVPAPTYRAWSNGRRCDRWQIVKYVFPSNIEIDAGIAPTGSGAPAGDRSQGTEFRVLHVLTPATETSTWYFWVTLRNHHLDDREMGRVLQEAMGRILEEDKVVLNAQQRAVLSNPGERLVNVHLDEASVHVRNIIQKCIDGERGVGAERT